MHPDLSRHLHNDECNALIEALNKCHHEHKVGRLLGKCNDIDRAVNKCLKKEYEKRRDANRFRKRKQKESAESAESSQN